MVDSITPEGLRRAYAKTFGDADDQLDYNGRARLDQLVGYIRDESPADGDGYREKVKRLDTIDRTPAPPLLLGYLDPLESTMLFGPGDIGKGTLACQWSVQPV